MSDSLHLNDRALRVADVLAEQAAVHRVSVQDVGGARVIDAGVGERGGLGAGLMLARMCMADLGEVSFVPGCVNDRALPMVAMHTDQPVAACMASQYAGWQISVDKYFAMGSGPMRAVRGKEELFDDIGHREQSDCVVGVLESSRLPDDKVVSKIAGSCGVEPSALTLAVAPTASLAGGTQVVARSVETALHKLHELGFDLSRVVAGFGQAPLPPVASDDMAAIGRTNDAMLYGAQCMLYVTGDDESLIEVGRELPSSASKDYGAPFAEIFKRYDYDFYKIDPMLFSPAVVSLQNVDSGKTHTVGKINHDVLSQSFFG